MHMSHAELEMMMNRLDSNHDGEITFKEISDVLGVQEESKSSEVLIKDMPKIDTKNYDVTMVRAVAVVALGHFVFRARICSTAPSRQRPDVLSPSVQVLTKKGDGAPAADGKAKEPKVVKHALPSYNFFKA